MAELKRKTLQLSTGKQIKLYGNSIAIGKTLEIGEGYRPNIYSCADDLPVGKSCSPVCNPYQLNREELLELADFNIQLWMDLKKNLYRFGPDDVRVFDMETPAPKKSGTQDAGKATSSAVPKHVKDNSSEK